MNAAVPPPVFHECPNKQTLSIDLAEGEATALVNWSEPTASDHNGNRISVTLAEGTYPPVDMGPGMTEIVYEASTEAGSRSTCEFFVEVHGKSLMNIN